MTKMGNENAVDTDPVVGQVVLEDGTVKDLHASGFTTAKVAAAEPVVVVIEPSPVEAPPEDESRRRSRR